MAKILQVVADGAPGGGTTCVMQLIEDLMARGHQIALATQHDSYAQRSGAELGARTFDRLDFFRSRFDRGISQQLAECILAYQPELIHLHGGRAAFFESRTPRDAATHRIPRVYTVHGYHFTRQRLPLRWLSQMAERRSCRHAAETVFVSEYDQRLAERYRFIDSNHPHRVIHNGVATDELVSAGETPIGSRDPKRVIAVGRLTFQKDPHRVLDIAARLAMEGFRFDLVGGGEMEAEIRQRVASERLAHVTIHGALSRSRTLELLSQAGAFLLASRWEGLPIAPLEAMQAGVPVVLSDVGGNPEVVEHGVSGCVVPQVDTEGFAEALRQIAADPSLAQRFRDAGRQRVQEVFGRSRMVDQYESLYRDWLG